MGKVYLLLNKCNLINNGKFKKKNLRKPCPDPSHKI
jgi:hypothetical protein